MLINTAGLSSLYDMYKQTALTPYTQAGQTIITKQMWDRYWEIQIKDTNFLAGGREGEPFWKNVTLACLDLMDHVGAYMIGEFDCHNNEELSEIWANLIKAWYFGKVWIIKSEDVMNLEISLATSEAYRESIPEEKLFRGNPFRIFERYQNSKNQYLFKSLLTGIDGFELNPEEMIYLSLNEGANFRRWWKINMEYVSGLSRITDSIKALNKTVQVIVKNQRNYRYEEAQIENPSVFFRIERQTGTLGAKEQNIYQDMPIIDTGDRVKIMKDLIESMYQRQCEILGFTINSNDKKERLTVAENYKDLRQITNLQDWQLKNLKIFEKKLKKFGWVDEGFKIEIAGLAYAQGLPDTVLSNQLPNNLQEFGKNNKIESND